MLVASTFALLSLIVPPVSIVSSATVALVTLRRGAADGLSVLGSSSIAAGLLGYFLIGNYQFALLYVMVLWMPVWLISIVLREGRHLSLAVEITILLGIIGIAIFYLFNQQPFLMWKQVLVQMIPAETAVDNVQHTIDLLAQYMTGIVAAGSVFGLLFGLFLGRWWQAILFNPGGFRQEFLSLTTKPRMVFGSLAVAGFAWAGSGVLAEAARNITILLFVLYMFIGTAVLHSVFARMKQGRFMTPMFYVTLFLIPHTMLPVAFVGLIDPWLDLRNKINSN